MVIPALGEAACQPVIWEASQPRDIPHSCGATCVSTGLLVGLSEIPARLTLGTVASPLGHPVIPYPMVNYATSGAVGPLIIMVVGWSLSWHIHHFWALKTWSEQAGQGAGVRVLWGKGMQAFRPSATLVGSQAPLSPRPQLPFLILLQ